MNDKQWCDCHLHDKQVCDICQLTPSQGGERKLAIRKVPIVTNKAGHKEVARIVAELKAALTANADLLEALKELLRVDDDWHGSVNSEMAAARRNARSAIAKAEVDESEV